MEHYYEEWIRISVLYSSKYELMMYQWKKTTNHQYSTTACISSSKGCNMFQVTTVVINVIAEWAI